MSLTIWEVFQSLLRRGEGADEESSGDQEDDRFVPSPLDLSVRVAHGGADDSVVRELSKVDEKAQELENTQQDR